MKTINYKLQNQLEYLGPLTQEKYFREYLKEVLESDKPYYVKSDYIALSFMELDNKIQYLTDEIKTLTNLKKRLQEAKTLGLEITAQMLQEYGIDKMEGTAVSSLTITPPKKKVKETFKIKDPQKVMELGYVKFSVDEQALKEAIKHPEVFTEVDPYVEVSIEEETVPARLKINKRRNSSTVANGSIEILETQEAA